jgi:16S rRNA (guanine(966)-N(2))-methyltransferase RsmD
MRIISGEFRRRQLISPKDASTTRPIPDRVKESVFSILRGHFEGARVLDAFAGSGSIGLEALSRGASFVLFVERDKAAANLLERNIEMLGCGDRCEVLRADAIGPATLARCPRPLDLAFFDPPYPLVEDPASWDRIRGQVGRVADLLTPVGFVVVRTPWPFFQSLAEPEATPDSQREARKFKDRKERLGRKLREQEWVLDEIDPDEIEAETIEDETELEEIETVEAAAAAQRKLGDLTIEGAVGPETHAYGSTAVHLYMRCPPAAA